MNTEHVLRYPFEPPPALAIPPQYASLRSTQPVVEVQMPYGGRGWLVTRYEDAKLVFCDPRFSRAAAAGKDVPRMRPKPAKKTSIMAMDPPEHTRLRRLIAPSLTKRRTEQLRAHTKKIAQELVAAMVANGPPCDIVADFAVPLPINVLLKLLGVTTEDTHRLVAAADVVMSSTSHTAEDVTRARQDLAQVINQHIAARRENPTDDLLGTLVSAHEAGERLTDAELLDITTALLVVGWETTTCQIANFVYLLITYPEHMHWLLAHPEAIPKAVEELLRYTPLNNGAEFARVATEDVSLGGVLIRKGDAVLVSIPSANRDEAVFAAPETLKLTRPDNHHLAFGHGPHHCVGANLARMEIQVALKTLIEGIPGLQKAVPDQEVTWRSGSILRAPTSLPVTW
ncbi:cytochrome P450 [Saccharopolyspora shandongensis]|uniref:cytochrome P450 n=1 Tax=Saccharopolyspora shandongensis TaxID=418495 RepID=UPI003448F59B